jgi:hypothetical protein
MNPKEYNSRKYGKELTRQLVVGAIIIILLIGLSFVAFQMGQGAFFFAVGTFAIIGVIIGMVWIALKFIELLSRSDDE